MLGNTKTLDVHLLSMAKTMAQELFMKPEITHQGREMLSRSDAVRIEMASAVRLLGEGGATAKDESYRAARKTGLPSRLIERLRYRKITRIAADVADIIREAVAAHQAKQEALARHEIDILFARLQALETRLETTDPDFHGGSTIPALQSLRRTGLLAGPGPASSTEGGEG